MEGSPCNFFKQEAMRNDKSIVARKNSKLHTARELLQIFYFSGCHGFSASDYSCHLCLYVSIAIFFSRVILYNFFLFWLIYGGLGLGSYIGFLGLGSRGHNTSPWWDFLTITFCFLYFHLDQWVVCTTKELDILTPWYHRAQVVGPYECPSAHISCIIVYLYYY